MDTMIQCLNDMIAYVGNVNIGIKDISNVRRKEDFQVEKETLVPYAIILFLFFDDAVDEPDLSTERTRSVPQPRKKA